MEDEPATEILEATYRALCDHGYANLTMQDIAAESDRSKASIHYHYDSKDELFAAFLGFLYEEYTARIDAVSGETPRGRLLSLLEVLLADGDDAPEREFQTAMLEVKAQAPYDDALRDQLVEFDEFLFERIRDVVAAGVEAGDFDDSVDPAVAAEFLTTAVEGARTRRVAVDHSTERLYDIATRYVETQLGAGEAAEGAH